MNDCHSLISLIMLHLINYDNVKHTHTFIIVSTFMPRSFYSFMGAPLSCYNILAWMIMRRINVERINVAWSWRMQILGGHEHEWRGSSIFIVLNYSQFSVINSPRFRECNTRILFWAIYALAIWPFSNIFP